jgi:hypothetical protein
VVSHGFLLLFVYMSGETEEILSMFIAFCPGLVACELALSSVICSKCCHRRSSNPGYVNVNLTHVFQSRQAVLESSSWSSNLPRPCSRHFYSSSSTLLDWVWVRI